MPTPGPDNGTGPLADSRSRVALQDNRAAPALSLVVPTYNRGGLIAETLRHALAQTLPFLEVILVDNNSTDDTPAVLAGFAPQVTVLHCREQGVQAARNLGAQQARGDYIVFCDSDDLLRPGYAQALTQLLQAAPHLDVVYSNFTNFSQAGESADKFSQAPPGFFAGAREHAGAWLDVPDLYLRTLRFQPLFFSGVAVRRAHYQRLGGFDTAFRGVGAEDWEFTLRALEKGRHGLLRQPLVRIRRHASNDSASSLHMLRGEAAILQHAARAHETGSAHAPKLQAEAQQRLRAAFDLAFAAGQMDLARSLALSWTQGPGDPRRRVKTLLLRLPGPLLRLAWQASQRVRPAAPGR